MSENAIEFKAVCKAYDHPSGSVEVLKDCDLMVRGGQRIGILGPSGSGKSTLLSIASGLALPEGGQVTVAGQLLNDMNQDQLCRYRSQFLGIVFQQYHLIPHLTALENVALSLEIAGSATANAKANTALEEVEMDHRAHHYPGELSGGECQRVAIARAMVRRPPVLLADEPSGNLDRRTGDQVMETLFAKAEQANTTLLLVTHNEEHARRCDQILHMDQGRLHASPA
jgi:putative ABC transport system ATP-binding protein